MDAVGLAVNSNVIREFLIHQFPKWVNVHLNWIYLSLVYQISYIQSPPFYYHSRILNNEHLYSHAIKIPLPMPRITPLGKEPSYSKTPPKR